MIGLMAPLRHQIYILLIILVAKKSMQMAVAALGNMMGNAGDDDTSNS